MVAEMVVENEQTTALSQSNTTQFAFSSISGERTQNTTERKEEKVLSAPPADQHETAQMYTARMAENLYCARVWHQTWDGLPTQSLCIHMEYLVSCLQHSQSEGR